MYVFWKLVFFTYSVPIVAAEALNRERNADSLPSELKPPVNIYRCSGEKSKTTYEDCQKTAEKGVCYWIANAYMYRSCADLCNDAEEHSDSELQCKRYAECQVYLTENCNLTPKNPPTAAPSPAPESTAADRVTNLPEYKRRLPDLGENSLDSSGTELTGRAAPALSQPARTGRGRIGLSDFSVAAMVVAGVIAVFVTGAVGVAILKNVISSGRSGRESGPPGNQSNTNETAAAASVESGLLPAGPILRQPEPECESEQTLYDALAVPATDTNDGEHGRSLPEEPSS